MIGLIWCLRHAVKSSTEPFITPWSVSARAGWSNDAARSASASILHAPSSSEYSEWTWRWTQGEGKLAGVRVGGQDRRDRPFTSIGIASDTCGGRRAHLAALCAREPLPHELERPLLTFDLDGC